MGMIGNQIAAGQALTIANDSFNGDGSTVAFTLSQTVGSVNDIEVLVDNVQQSPYDSSYSVNGTTLTFSGAPSTGTNNVYVIYNASRHIATQQVIPDDGSVHSSKIASGAVTDAKITGMAASKLTGALPALDGSALTGTAPAIATGDVIQRVSSQGETYSGSIIQLDGGSSQITETTAYNNASLTPLRSLSITAKRANSKFVIELIGKANISTGYRSQIALADTYTAGSYSLGLNLYYSHYGLYNSTGGNTYHGLSYRIDDPRNLAAGATRTYYWFGGSIGAGTQQYWNLNMSITEGAS